MADPIYTSASPIAVNPADGELIGGAVFTVHAPDDTSFSTPLAVTDPISGVAINPLRSNSNGTLPAFKVAGDLPRVILKSGAFVTELVSLGGLVSAQIDAAGLSSSVVAAAIASSAAAAGSASAAAGSAGAAADALAEVQAKAAEVASVVATNDGIMKAVLENPEAGFTRELSATFVSVSEAPLNVERYGADRDGAPSANRAAIQAAINAVQSAAKGAVLFPSAYEVDGRVEVTGSVRLEGLDRGSSGIRGVAGFSDSSLLNIAPATKSPVAISRMRVELPGSDSIALRVTNVAGGMFDNITVLGGQTGVSIRSNHHNSVWRDFVVSRYGDYGMDIYGDYATAELTFMNGDLSSNAGASGEAVVRIERKIAGDIGGYTFLNVLGVSGSRAMKYGLRLDASEVASGYATSPVYLYSGSHFDGQAVPLAATNWGNIYANGSWLSSDTPDDPTVRLEHVTDVILANSLIRGGSMGKGIGFYGAPSSNVQSINNRIPDATHAYYLDAAGNVTNFSYSQDLVRGGPAGANLTNNRSWLAAAQARTAVSGQVYLTGTSAESAVNFMNPSGASTFMRRTAGALDFLPTSFGSTLMSLDDLGVLTLLGGPRAPYVTLQNSVLPAASASNRGQIRMVQGAAGVADKLYQCMKSAADAYNWVEVVAAT